MTSPYLLNLHHAQLPPSVGGKAMGLRFLADHGYAVPATWICPTEAQSEMQRRPAVARQQLATQLIQAIDPNLSYAVRSSALLEDGLHHSFAGQFRTVLDVRGVPEILKAMEAVWASADSPGVAAYRAQNGHSPETPAMAVIVQEMVSPVVSGVSFSRNPVTGLNEVVIEAIAGSGDALVQQGLTPHRWVYKWGQWIARPANEPVPLPVLEQVAQQTQAIAHAYGHPVDLEWVYDGRELRWVQLRPITSAAALNVYSNRIAREVLPGIIKPLVWSVNIPLVNGAWIRLFDELVGPTGIQPEDLAKSFYYRAYFNMSTVGRIFEILGLPRDSLELLMGLEVDGLANAGERPSFKPSKHTIRHLPRLLGLIADKWRFGRRVEDTLPLMEQRYQELHRQGSDGLDEAGLLERIDHLSGLVQETAYFNIVVPLLMRLYYRALQVQLGRLNIEPERVDLTHDMADLHALDPARHLAQLHSLFSQLGPAVQVQVSQGHFDAPDATTFKQALDQFMDRFGHLSDSGNDFSSTPWRENPQLILDMVAAFSPGPPGQDAQVPLQELPVPVLSRPLLALLSGRARRFRLYREQVSSLYTFGYGLFRNYFIALGRRLVAVGTLHQAEDIFYLFLEEVRSIVNQGSASSGGPWANLVGQRRAEIESYRDASLPSTIFGDQAPPLSDPGLPRLKGTPTARGTHQGPVRVVKGLQDFAKLSHGDVLVIPYSDVSWTPLFRRAGAVIAESGGLLSHSSIVAREYGIPAIVSVPDACRLPDGTVVTVDAYKGEVILHDERREAISL